MQNTWSIGRTWKPRKGWSGPVLTGEDDPTRRLIPLGVGWSSGVVVVHGVTALSMAWFTLRYACFSRPLSGSRTSHGPSRPLSWGWLIISGFCGGHGPGETPGPFPNPEAKAWHGDGTALDRVWESSTPPQFTSEDPR